MRIRTLSAMFFVLLAVACAGSGSGSGSEGPRRGSANLITSAELQDVANLSAYEAIQRLRPIWLRPRSGSSGPVVFVDGAQMGDPNMLQSISAATVEEIRFRSASDATTRYGTGVTGGAIEVKTKS